MEIINTERLILTPINMSFVSEDYLNWLNNPKVNRYLVSNDGYSIEKLNDYVKRILNNNIMMWAIVIKETNKHIGNIKMDPIDSENQSVELGIMIGAIEEWGRGYAFETISAICRYFFDELEFNAITLGVERENLAATKLYKKLGFELIEDNKTTSYIRMRLERKGC
jgi:RimJ/RimL family protein N-acetyltransferase